MLLLMVVMLAIEIISILNNNQQWFGSSLFGVSMNIPIFSSGMRSAATQRAKINLEKAKDNLTETEQQLKFKLLLLKVIINLLLKIMRIKKKI